MKATKITYQKCFNLGNYQNEVVGIELEIEKGEKAIDVLDQAKIFVESRDFRKNLINEYHEKVNIIKNPDDYTGRQIREAQDYIDRFEIIDNLPF